MKRLCEYRMFTDSGCPAGALWLVRVGSRKADGQESCGRHLSATCGVMLAAESRDGACLTVTAIRPGGDQR